MKSVLIVTELFDIGGLETHIASEIACLSEAGINAHLATGSSNVNSLMLKKASSVTTGLKLGPMTTSLELEETVERLRAIIKEQGIDCVHAHPFTSLIPALIAAELEHVPFVLTLHGPASLATVYGPMYEFSLLSLVLSSTDLVIAVSQETAQLAALHVDDARLLVLPNAIANDYFDINTATEPTDKRWLLVSRLDSAKIVGIYKFIQYCAHAHVDGVLIAGDGEARPELEAQISQAGLSRFVELMGTSTDIPRLMRNASGVAGMGRVALEGMASGKPVMLVGYDGVKGLLTTKNYREAAYANFSGRNLPCIEQDTFTSQIDSPYDDLALLRQEIQSAHSDKSIWEQFARHTAELKSHGHSTLTHAYLKLISEKNLSHEPYLNSNSWVEALGGGISSAWHFKKITNTHYNHLKTKHMELKDIDQKNRMKEKELVINELSLIVEKKESLINEMTIKIEEQKNIINILQDSITEKSQYISERNKVIDNLKQEADSLFALLNEIMHSKSWKITRPLRGAMKLGKKTKTVAGPAVYEIAKKIGSKLPLSLDTKIKLKKVLQRYILASHDRAKIFSQVAAPTTFTDLPPRGGTMRSHVCGLEPNLVSVILPVYNQADLIVESIESVLAQSYENFELIIINDGSSDGLEEIIEPYLKNPKIYIYDQANQKLPKALSNGFSFARGEFWTWTSADNIMEPLMLEKLVNKLKASPDTGLVYADYYAIDDRGEILQDPSWRAHNRPNPASGEIRLPRSAQELNTVQDNFIGPCFMYRGWIGYCIGDYDPQLGVEDYDYWMRINAFFQVEHLGSDDLLYRYRVHDNTLSANAQEHRILDKVQKLMNYEQSRAEYFHQSLRLRVDAAMATFLPELGFSNNQLVSLQSASPADAIAIESSTLADSPRQFYDCNRPLIILINNPSFDYVKLKGLDPNRTMILANNRDTALQARLVTECPVIDALSQDTGRAVNVFCKVRHFLDSTRTKSDLQRSPPELVLPNSHPHVLLQVDSFIQGGLENVVIDLAVSLNTLGYHTSLAILGKEGDAALKARELGLHVISFGHKPTPDQYEALLTERNIGVVNAHYSTFGAKLCAQQNIPFIQTIHNSYVWLEPSAIDAFQAVDPYTTSYISVSATAARYAESVLGLSMEKMHVIANGINPDTVSTGEYEANRQLQRQHWNVAESEIVYLNVASVMATKAQLPLVNAFATVAKALPGAKLVLLGDTLEPAYLRKITDKISDLGLEHNVILAGYNRAVAKFYHASDIFVLPSFWEGWSLSLGEAAANGLKCVITDVGSAYEFNDDGNVAIVSPPFGDITNLNWSNLGDYIHGDDQAFEDRLATAMLNMARQPHEASPNYYEIFDRKRAYKKYAALFERVNLK